MGCPTCGLHTGIFPRRLWWKRLFFAAKALWQMFRYRREERGGGRRAGQGDRGQGPGRSGSAERRTRTRGAGAGRCLRCPGGGTRGDRSPGEEHRHQCAVHRPGLDAVPEVWQGAARAGLGLNSLPVVVLRGSQAFCGDYCWRRTAHGATRSFRIDGQRLYEVFAETSLRHYCSTSK